MTCVRRSRTRSLPICRSGSNGTVSAGCFHPRRIAYGRENLSRHAWGIAIDLNVDFSQPGAGPVPPQEFIEIWGRHGFRWGGDFTTPDNHHFEWVGTAGRGPAPDRGAVEVRPAELRMARHRCDDDVGQLLRVRALRVEVMDDQAEGVGLQETFATARAPRSVRTRPCSCASMIRTDRSSSRSLRASHRWPRAPRVGRARSRWRRSVTDARPRDDDR